MANQLTIVNNILRRLREDEVSSVVDNAYSKLIGQFVNDAKADMEDYNHEWSVYITEIDTTILNDGTRSYDLTSTTDRSWLMRDPDDDKIPLAYDVTSGEVGQLFDCTYKVIKRERALTNNITRVTAPKVFAVVADSDGRGWTIESLWGLLASESNRTWRSYWYIPQAELALDGSDDATEIKLPSRAIELRAMFYALNERGEEMGMFGGIADKRSTDAIASAMEVDATIQQKITEIDFTNKEML
jgi:hypothetical protein